MMGADFRARLHDDPPCLCGTYGPHGPCACLPETEPIGTCPGCGELMFDDGGPIRLPAPLGGGYVTYCSHACVAGERA